MGMEGQIMCIEQYTFYMSSVAFLGPQCTNCWRMGLRPRPHWGSLQPSLTPLAGFKGPTSKAPNLYGERVKAMEGDERGGGRKYLYPRAPETLMPPLPPKC